MGLDMYLYRRKKYRENDDEYNTLVHISKEEKGKIFISPFKN